MTTAVDSKKAWDDVAGSLSALGLKLKLHFAESGAKADAAGEVKDAFEHLGEAIQGAFTAIGKAAEDEAVREDVAKVAESLANALTASFSEAGEELAEAGKRIRCNHE
jgi:hypothetical protein